MAPQEEKLTLYLLSFKTNVLIGNELIGNPTCYDRKTVITTFVIYNEMQETACYS